MEKRLLIQLFLSVLPLECMVFVFTMCGSSVYFKKDNYTKNFVALADN